MRPVSIAIIAALWSSLRTRVELEVEILALRHELAVLQQAAPRRLRLSRADRMLWVLLSRCWPNWRRTLRIVQPATVVLWHRRAFALFWQWRSRTRRVGRPAIPTDLRDLIRQMRRANRLLDAPRIHGELLKLGFHVSETPVAKYLDRQSRGLLTNSHVVWFAYSMGSPANVWSARSHTTKPADRIYGSHSWRGAMTIVKPATVVYWHRRLFAWHWHSRSRAARLGRPPIARDVRALIRQMHHANPLWGAPRIHGELQNLGIEISETTVAKYLGRRPRPPRRPGARSCERSCRNVRRWISSPSRQPRSGCCSSSSSCHTTAAA